MADSSSEWQLQTHTFAERANYLLQNEEWSDCSFLFKDTEQKILKAHTVILAMSSPVFARMFYGSMAERNFPVLIEDVHADDFFTLLQYIYTGNVEFNSFDDASCVCYAAKKYMIPGLVKLCVDRVWDFLSPKTACLTYELAELCEDEELKEQCLKIISLDTVNVLRNPSFQDIKLTTLETILEMDSLPISSELELFNALCRWAKSELQRKVGEDTSVTVAALRSVVNTVLPKIRFLTFKPKEIAQRTADFDLLTSSENYAILVNLISPKEPKVSMPPGFSTSKIERWKNKSKLLQDRDRYSWIQNVNVTQETKETLYIINIHFQVAKKLKLVGIQMNPKHPGMVNSWDPTGKKVLSIELQSASGCSVSSSYFHQVNMNPPTNITIEGWPFLERNNYYVVKITSFPLSSNNHQLGQQYQPRSSLFNQGHYYQQQIGIPPQTVHHSSANQDASSNNTISYTLQNLLVESIVFSE